MQIFKYRVIGEYEQSYLFVKERWNNCLTYAELKIVVNTENITGEGITYEKHRTADLDEFKNVCISNF